MWPWTKFKRLALEKQALVELVARAQASADEWHSRYVRCNDEFGAARGEHTKFREDTAKEQGRVASEVIWRTKECDRLSEELHASVLLTKDLIQRLGTPAPPKNPAAARRLREQDDPFAEQTDQPSVYVDRPGASPAELGEEIAQALPGR